MEKFSIPLLGIISLRLHLEKHQPQMFGTLDWLAWLLWLWLWLWLSLSSSGTDGSTAEEAEDSSSELEAGEDGSEEEPDELAPGVI